MSDETVDAHSRSIIALLTYKSHTEVRSTKVNESSASMDVCAGDPDQGGPSTLHVLTRFGS